MVEQPNTKRLPLAALLWSAMMPGFGQFYNRDYVMAIILFTSELAINVLGNINSYISIAFNPHVFPGEMILTEVKWLLFYPGLWSFSMWHAYNRALEINSQSDNSLHRLNTRLTGAFIGLTIGMQLGLIWPLFHGSIISSLFLGVVGLAIGFSCEVYTLKAQQKLCHMEKTNSLISLKDTNFKMDDLITHNQNLKEDFNNYDYMFVLDQHCHYLFVSKSALEYSGLDSKDICGKHWREIGKPSEAMEPFEAAFSNVVSTGKSLVLEQHVAFAVGKARRHFKTLLTPLCIENNQVTAVLCASKDVTNSDELGNSQVLMRNFNITT